MQTKTALALALMAAALQPARAADWRYCLAPAQIEHKVYVSDAFPAQGLGGETERTFERFLEQGNLGHGPVQCPRADDERSILSMRQYAITFNQRNGVAIVHVPIGRPNAFVPSLRGGM